MLGRSGLKVSIIVISRNEEKIIEQCLESIFRQTYPNIEVIIVDSSTDNTPDIIRSLSNFSPFPIKVIFQEAKGCGFARNTGLNEASGDVVTFVDADVLIPPNYVESAIREFEDSRCLGVWTKGILAKPSNLLGQVFWLYERIFHPGKPAVKNGKCLDATIFRTWFLKDVARGYNVTLRVGEDVDLWRRVRRKIEELSKEGFYFKQRNDIEFIEFKHIRDGDFRLRNHFSKMIWYGQGKLCKIRMKSASIWDLVKELLAPIYLASVPLLTLIAALVAWQCSIFLLPYLALFPLSVLKTLHEGFKDCNTLLISLLFPLIMVFKSLGLIIGMVRSIIK